ncbi:thioredoxin reductase 1, cytoplasmic-like [Hetaerina americana]|uniref:thioredoxin reductase 1, cytoplasmic-like n=1 Tax=Hetaerina americana TaxID=62018 RepID=UPI003A7F38F6
MEKVQALIRKNAVMVFSKSYCKFCNKVKDIFRTEKIDFHSIELDLMCPEGAVIQDALAKLTKQTTVPNVFLHGEHVGGCDATVKLFRDGTLAERALGTYRKRDFDLVVIGGGSGGLAAAKEAASLGRKVAVCDFVTPSPRGTKWGLGGTCVNVGCIPKKLMHKSALLGADIKDSNHFGWEKVERAKHNWEKMAYEVKSHILSLNFGYRSDLMLKKVQYYNAYATFLDKHKLKLVDKNENVIEITSDNIIVAVGGRPNYPDIPGAREYGITSDDLFYLQNCPGKTLIVGASYVALECAGFLAGFGLDVTVMVRSILLRGFDQQMAYMIGAHMESHGVKFLKNTIPLRITEKSPGSPGELAVAYKMCDGKVKEQQFNTVMFATGRSPCTSNIGLEEIGVELNKRNGKIAVDDYERSSVKNIFAIGDVRDRTPELTPVAIQAGRLLAKRLYGQHDEPMDYKMVPTTVFTPLEYGCVGYSEEDLIALFGPEDIEVYHTHFQPLEFTLPERDKNKCYGKLICLKSAGEKVVGFHILGPNAGEITQGFALAMKLNAKKSDFDDLVGIHPTCAEIFTTMLISKASGISVEKSSC